MRNFLTATAALFCLAACSPSPGERPVSDANSGDADVGEQADGDVAIEEQRCDPVTDPTCRLDVELGDQPCSFHGHAPGDIPSLTPGEPTHLPQTDIVAAAYVGSQWVVATADGSVVQGEEVIAQRNGSTLLDLSAATVGLALSRHEGNDLVVELRAPAGEWREVLRVEVGPDRVGGGLALEDDGTLWIAIGDGEEEWRAIDPSTLPGSLLRIDATTDPYTIPPENPYTDGDSGRPEIWATGLGDPSHCSVFDGDVWCSDVGEFYVELNRAAKLADYGWPYADGPGCRQANCSDDRTGPVAFRLASDECGLIPGPLLPADLPDSEGARVYAGKCSGRLWGVRSTEEGVRATRNIGRVDAELVALDADQSAVLTVGPDGAERRWEFTDETGAFPETMAASGCLTPQGEFGASLVPYEIAAELWTDGAHKERFIALPAGTKIVRKSDGELRFPEGTSILKMFERELSDGSFQLLETRVMRLRNDAWDFYTYQWNDAGEAELLTRGADVEVQNPAGGETYTHRIPSRVACQSCHVESKRVLGPVNHQLHRDVSVDDRQAPQLALFEAAGILEGESTRPPVVDPFDESATLDERARSYLHANCSHCHRPDGWAPGSLGMDLRYDTPLSETGVCGVPAEFGRVWADGDLRIDPGRPENSNLLQRMLVDNLGRMPPMGTAVIDLEGAAVVEEWIASLTSCD